MKIIKNVEKYIWTEIAFIALSRMGKIKSNLDIQQEIKN